MPSDFFPIACAINDAYILPLAVLLDSLKRHLSPSYRPVLYLIHTGLSPARLDLLAASVETHAIVPSAAELGTLPRDPRFPAEAAMPLLLAELLPASLERVLFLDADMLVMDDPAQLWETGLDGHVLAAAPDGAVPRCSSPRGVKNWKRLGIPAAAPYFNGGLLLIDLVRWREREVNRRVRHYFETVHERIDFLHQEALNAVLWNDWKQLDERWNLPARYAPGRTTHDAPEASPRPGIVHFAGRMKPWRAPAGGPFNASYQETLQRVLALVPPEPPSLRDRLQSAYDRHFRDAFYPLEQFLWRQRLI